MSLYEVFETVSDPRRKEGLRTTLPQMFCMITLSNLCGHFGGRPVARFAKAHEDTFTEALHLRHGVPSHVIFSDVLNRVDSKELINAFNKWASTFVPVEQYESVSGDGKALASTVTHHGNTNQDFEAVVSIFCQKSGLVRAVDQYRNSKQSEINVVRFLIEQFNGMGLTFHLDALHAQKNG